MENAGYSDIQVSVNIVAQQIHRGLLLSDLVEVLEKYQLDGSNLELEITESALLDNTDNVKNYYIQLKSGIFPLLLMTLVQAIHL